MAAAIQTAQPASPIASRHGDFQFVAIDEANATLDQNPFTVASIAETVPFSLVEDTVPYTLAGVLPYVEDNENIEPQAARHSKSPTSRRTDARNTRERLVDLPLAFESLNDAYDVLHPVHDRLAALIMSIESSADTVVTSFSQDNYRIKATMWLSLWESAFARLLQSAITGMTPDQRKAAMTLKAHHLVAECFSIVQPTETALDWSGSSAKFQAVLDLADYVMRGVQVQPESTSHRQSGNMNNSIDSFQTTLPHITILDPVYEVQIRTTNVTLRDRATQLLSMIRPRHFSTGSELQADHLQIELQDDQALTTR